MYNYILLAISKKLSSKKEEQLKYNILITEL